MTPEFPRAPIKRPLAKIFATSPTVEADLLETSLAPFSIVIPILVPVSPSGTGKTFKEFTYSACLFRRVDAACTIS